MPGTLYARLRARRRLLVSDVDGTLLDGAKAAPGCSALAQRLQLANAGLVLCTGRDLELTMDAAKELMSAGLPRPDALICSVGSEIYLGEDNRPDERWNEHIGADWDLNGVKKALAGIEGLEPQGEAAQRQVKASYFFSGEPSSDRVSNALHTRVSDERALSITEEARRALIAAGLRATLIASAGSFLDVLPSRASKGAAVSWLLSMAALDPTGVVVAGDSGNDREMLLTDVAGKPLRAVVVGNHEPELADVAGLPNVYLAERSTASGVLEGLLAHGW